MATDLWLVSLEYAIGRGDIPMLSKLLQEAKQPIPPEIARQLGGLLDPDAPFRKPGPKPKKKYYGVTHHLIIDFYYYLCENPVTALKAIYPGHNISQKNTPKKVEIRDLICKMYGISLRKFDDMRAEHNRRR